MCTNLSTKIIKLKFLMNNLDIYIFQFILDMLEL